MERPYQQCALTVMDTIADPDITFDENGISNYYHAFKKAEREFVFTGAEGDRRLKDLVDKIKAEGRNKPYDCIMGLSGGVDSTYVAYQAKQLGLRPLAVHFDNSWNSELAVKNIENIVSRLGLDLYTLVVDWEEFRDIQLSYMKASVVDIEVVSDHGIFTTLYKLAKKYKIKYVLSGNNVATEYIMPRSWLFNKMDHVNLRAIHKRFGTVPLKTYPVYDTALKKYCHDILQIRTVTMLDYMPYNKKAVKELIAKELDWRDYGGKHYESLFTKFYQAYILPEKFHIDKRKAHLSTLICSGQMTKEEALKELAQPLYTPEALKLDYEYVLKKLGLSTSAFEAIMKLPPKKHTDYPIERGVFDRFPVLRPLKPLARMIRKV
ncbi:MAG TPA: N-acetyl sugar amidotransferase [Puia sp.]|uniref:N-acetyl sugar amidotransferase n=1 Tax=Puia sp. TaxID=2045100 RepID=UPI002B91B5D6|nr:N-acetyl sugar amidotransferase [Puia sp.]HVU98934.1 N-acetyl sugar amidotransferase [Puia sp.]